MKDGARYAIYRFPIINQTNLLEQIKRPVSRSNDTRLAQPNGQIKRFNDHHQSISSSAKPEKILNQKIVINRADVRCYSELEKQIFSKQVLTRTNEFITIRTPKKEVLTKLNLVKPDQFRYLRLRSRMMASLKEPEQMKPINTLSAKARLRCPTDTNNNFKIKENSCSNNYNSTSSNNSDQFSDQSTNVRTTASARPMQPIDGCSIRADKAPNSTTTAADLKTTQIAHIIKNTEKCSNSSEHRSATRASDTQSANLNNEGTKGRQDQNNNEITGVERKVRKRPNKSVDLKQKELNRKVLDNFLKKSKQQGMLVNQLIKSLPVQLVAIGLGSNRESSSTAEAQQSNKCTSSSNEITDANLEDKSIDDLQTGAAHPNNGRHGDEFCAVINKKTKSSLIVSPFHQKADKSQQFTNGNTKLVEAKLTKFNGQKQPADQQALTNLCLDCVQRSTTTTKSSKQKSERRSKRDHCEHHRTNIGKKTAKRTIKSTKMDEVSVDQQSKSNPDTSSTGTTKSTEPQASLSKQNSFDSPAKTASSTASTNSPSTETVWSNLREDYELGEVIGRLLVCVCV